MGASLPAVGPWRAVTPRTVVGRRTPRRDGLTHVGTVTPSLFSPPRLEEQPRFAFSDLDWIWVSFAAVTQRLRVRDKHADDERNVVRDAAG